MDKQVGNFSYKTVKEKAEGFFSDRKSKFYSFVYPVENEEDVKQILKELRKKYHDARHHVYAFRLGADKKLYRYSDDGEPANSSGLPVFNVIKSYDLTNVLIVVVRYFGGKKLGIPGLINAYRTAAEDAVGNATIVEKKLEVKYKIVAPYSELDFVMNSVQKFKGKILAQNYSENCEMEVSLPKELESQFVATLGKDYRLKLTKV